MTTLPEHRKSFKRSVSSAKARKRVRSQIEQRCLDSESLEFLEDILDPDFSLMNLRQDMKFWKLMSTDNRFNTAVVETVVDTKSEEKVETFFTMVFMKLQAKEIFHKCLQKMYNKFIDTMVTENQTLLLESLFKIDFSQWETADFNPKMKNLPALVKACMANNYEVCRILVANGFLLR